MTKLPPLPKRMFARYSPKAAKALAYGYHNAILYLAPHEYAGVGNLCPHASPACAAACLGLHSGQASMVKSERKCDANNVRKSRALKARHFMLARAGFMRSVILDIAHHIAKAERAGLTLAVRLNGSSDIAYEGITVDVSDDDARRIRKLCGHIVAAGKYRNVFELFPSIQFLDYTKNPQRMARALPANYHLTFSRSEANEAQTLSVLSAGGNVAVVFDRVPPVWHSARVIDGDKHDLRFLDPRGVVVGLTPKGLRAKRDKSGFVVRMAQESRV